MGETVAGGATLAADGKTYKDANGQPVSAEKIAELHEINAQRAAQQRASGAQTRAIQRQQLAADLEKVQALRQQSDGDLIDDAGDEYGGVLPSATFPQSPRPMAATSSARPASTSPVTAAATLADQMEKRGARK